jgi:hypothetical protein
MVDVLGIELMNYPAVGRTRTRLTGSSPSGRFSQDSFLSKIEASAPRRKVNSVRLWVRSLQVDESRRGIPSSGLARQQARRGIS